MRSIAALVRVALVVACLTASMAKEGAAQGKDTWWEFTTSINHNGKDWLGRDPIYFAEIRLRIPKLSETDVAWLNEHAKAEHLVQFKNFLKGKLRDSVPTIRDAKERIIEAVRFRGRAFQPGEVRGIDWVNIGTGVDYSSDSVVSARTDSAHFAEIHLRIPLTAESKKAIENFAAAGDYREVGRLLMEAVGNDAGSGLIRALKFKRERQ